MVKDVDNLLPVNVRLIPFWTEVENASANQRHSCFSFRTKTANLEEDVEVLLSVSLNFFKWFQTDAKIVLANQRPGRHSSFTYRSEKHKLGRRLRGLDIVKIRLILFSDARGEVENVSVNQRPGRPSCFYDRRENTNLVEDIEILFSLKIGWILLSNFRGEGDNVSVNQRPGRQSCYFRSARKLAEDDEILIPVKSCWIPLGVFRGEVENVSANQSHGNHLVFPIGRTKQTWERTLWYCFLLSSLNSVQRFQRRGRKCFSESEASAAILFIDLPENNTLGRGRYDLASCQVSLNLVPQFQRRNRKCLSQSEARAVKPIGMKT